MGYKREQFVDKVDENLICLICHEVLQDPCGCKDGHSFCRECITEWLKIKQTCPMDNNSVLEVDLVRNLIAHNMVQNLKVWCHPPEPKDEVEAAGIDLKTKDPEKLRLRGQRPNNKCVFPVLEKKCEWKGKLQSLVKHGQACLFQQIQCPNENCTETMQRRELAEHNKKCEYRKLECKKCRKVLARNDLQKHTNEECPETPVPCPNKCTRQRQGQIQQIKRADMNNHIINTCPKTILDCPFKDQGCSVQVERQHVDKHVQDNMAAHMMLLAKQCSSLIEQNTTLTEECSALNERCLSLTENNRLLKEELNEVKEKFHKQLLRACSYTWIIANYPDLSKNHFNGSKIESPTFWLCGFRLSFSLYPNGNDSDTKEFLSLYLEHVENDWKASSSIMSNVSCKESKILYRLSVISQEQSNVDVCCETDHVFTKKSSNWGWPKFMKSSDALSPSYCKNNKLLVQCTVLPE